MRLQAPALLRPLLLQLLRRPQKPRLQASGLRRGSEVTGPRPLPLLLRLLLALVLLLQLLLLLPLLVARAKARLSALLAAWEVRQAPRPHHLLVRPLAPAQSPAPSLRAAAPAAPAAAVVMVVQVMQGLMGQSILRIP